MHFQICGNNDGNIIHVFKNCISISVATVLEVSKMTEPICTSHWCLVMSFWLKVCIYSHTRGVKLGLGLGFMQTSQVLPHWLNQSFSFWTLSYTQRHCHVRIEKGPVQTVAIILEAHNFLEYHYLHYIYIYAFIQSDLHSGYTFFFFFFFFSIFQNYMLEH